MTAAAGATAAAAAARQKAAQEEEEMTPYSENDLSEGWEFKILRSANSAFKKPEKLREALEEESRAGWVLIEKFDNQRLRLKRPASAKHNDATLGVDPYRTSFGASDGQVAFVVVGVVVGLIALLAGLIAFLD